MDGGEAQRDRRRGHDAGDPPAQKRPAAERAAEAAHAVHASIIARSRAGVYAAPPNDRAMVLAPSTTQPFGALVLDFLSYLEFERGLSRNTLDAYRNDLAHYGAWLDAGDRDPLTVGPGDLAEFVEGMEGAPATVQRRIACLRSFHRHLRRRGLTSADPSAGLSAPREPRRLPQPLSREEVARLLAQPAGDSPAAL